MYPGENPQKNAFKTSAQGRNHPQKGTCRLWPLPGGLSFAGASQGATQNSPDRR